MLLAEAWRAHTFGNQSVCLTDVLIDAIAATRQVQVQHQDAVARVPEDLP